MKAPKPDFPENSTVGDILFLLLASFVLVFMLANFDASNAQEKALPDVQLSKILGLPGGNTRHTAVAVTVIWEEHGNHRVLLDDKEFTLPAAEEELTRLGGLGKVSLRCDERVSVGVQNQVIAACQRAGIERVALVVKAEGGK